jgi:hypothetical protein
VASFEKQIIPDLFYSHNAQAQLCLGQYYCHTSNLDSYSCPGSRVGSVTSISSLSQFEEKQAEACCCTYYRKDEPY